ncbi:tetratricopeptide repeat protein [Sphingomonas sp.]|uniref:tetratricopeptide repeat protein n=1 Tax=Sphingomonas sp. TaxID=28214 RepID=UPI003F80EEF2
MTVWLAGAMLMLVPLSATAQDKAATTAADPIDQAFSAIQAGNPTSALALVDPLLAGLERDYATEKKHIFCSETPEQEGYYLTTTDGGSDNVRLVPARWCQAQYIKAFALVDLKRYDEAQATYERLLGYAPQNARYINELGYLFLAKKQWQRSIDVYTRAEAAATFSPDRRDYERCVAYRGIGYDLVELGRLDDAEAAYRKCLAIIPDEPKSLGEIEYIKQQRKKTT